MHVKLIKIYLISSDKFIAILFNMLFSFFDVISAELIDRFTCLLSCGWCVGFTSLLREVYGCTALGGGEL